jgi:2-phospho-L-lactate guanylyltransferase
MTARRIIHAVVPVKDTAHAKQRLGAVLSPAQRQDLALAMLADVLAALALVRDLAGILVVTADAAAAAIAGRHGARVVTNGARAGHTGAVAVAARQLGRDGMLALPGDIPLVEPDDIRQLIVAHGTGAQGAAFTIAPARDDRGSNAVLCTPADAVALRFGADSFFPHLAAARSCGIAPQVVRRPRIALDIDTPDDLALFLRTPSPTRAYALLARWRVLRKVPA